MKGQFVAYYRVSTLKQGHSGLGLDAQRKTVLDYLDGGRWELLAEFTEVETGKRDDRPELRKALELARRQKATLVIAKLDRLSRNLAFIATLQESKVKFVCADMPDANEMTIQIMAVMAQYERKLISERTKAALAAAKARGVKLGNPHLMVTNEQRQRQAVVFAETLRTTLESFAACGLTQRAMVATLNQTGVRARRGGSWSLAQLQGVLRRLHGQAATRTDDDCQ